MVLSAFALGGLQAQQAPAVYLAVPGRANANASIAADGQRVAVAWGARDPKGATDVYVSTSADGGRTFTSPVLANDRIGVARINGEQAPRVVFVPRTGQTPAIDVLWTSRETETTIRIARSMDGGKTFGASRELQGARAAGERGWQALTADSRGGVHALWLDHRAMAADRSTAGAHHHGQDGAPDKVASTNGAATAQKSGLYYSNGSTARELVRGVCYCCKTALATSADGNVFAAWRHVYPGNLRDIAFSVSRDGGRLFSSPVRVSEDRWQLDGCPDDGPAMALDARGTVHLVWPTLVSRPKTHKAMFYATSADGRAFTTRMRVSPEGRNISHPQVAVSREGSVAVLWDEFVNGQRRAFLSRRVGNEFTSPDVLGDTSTYPVPVFVDSTLVVAATEGSVDDSRVAVRRY